MAGIRDKKRVKRGSDLAESKSIKKRQVSVSEDSSEVSSSSGSDLGSEPEDDEIEDDEVEDDEIGDEFGDSDSGSDDESDEGSGEKRTNRSIKEEAFGRAFNAILSSKVKAHDRDNPILIRNKNKVKSLESSKLESKAKRAITADKKALEQKDRVKNILEPRDGKDTSELLEHERKLKKIAQRGVVRLFNAVLASQNVRSSDSVAITKKEEHMTEMSKEKFLDLIRSGGKITGDA